MSWFNDSLLCIAQLLDRMKRYENGLRSVDARDVLRKQSTCISTLHIVQRCMDKRNLSLSITQLTLIAHLPADDYDCTRVTVRAKKFKSLSELATEY